ncbi:lysine-rich nucleolar protein 1 isoform X2 [Pungitius pungitius]
MAKVKAEKKKKSTKEQASPSVKKSIAADDGKKDKKKVKRLDIIVIDEDSLDDIAEQKKTKKKKIVTESMNGSLVKDGNDKEVSQKKKKKTAQLTSVTEEVEESPRKLKKTKNRSVQNVKQNEEDDEEHQCRKGTMPKKETRILVVNKEKSGKQVKEKKKMKTTTGTKKKKSPEVTENGDTCDVEEVKVKRKMKKQTTADVHEMTSAAPQRKGKKRKSPSGQELENDKKNPPTKTDISIMDKEEKKPKKSKKVEEVSVEVSKIKEKQPKKKKKKRIVENSKEEEEEQLILNEVEETETVDPDTASKKKKKNKKGSSRVETKMKDLSSGTGAKKRKIKEEVEHPDESNPCDVVFLSKKAGNTDEVTINQERRLALQMEIDKASQPQKPDKPLGVGPWATAQFNTSEQQQKFLRLMGGFKKGFQPAVGSSDRANMALGEDAQQQLQQGLLGEFERAQSRRMDVSNRASGLGFSAPANKKFSIDINACRSVRFDD